MPIKVFCYHNRKAPKLSTRAWDKIASTTKIQPKSIAIVIYPLCYKGDADDFSKANYIPPFDANTERSAKCGPGHLATSNLISSLES